MMVCDVEQTHLHPPLCRLIMCKADSLSNWSLVVYMSFKVVYSEAFEIHIVLVLHVMNTNESWTWELMFTDTTIAGTLSEDQHSFYTYINKDIGW